MKNTEDKIGEITIWIVIIIFFGTIFFSLYGCQTTATSPRYLWDFYEAPQDSAKFSKE